MFWLKLFLGIFIYFIIACISIASMIKYQDELDIPDYDTEHDYDDFSSTKEAITTWSVMWPLWWSFRLLYLCWKLFSKITDLIYKKLKR